MKPRLNPLVNSKICAIMSNAGLVLIPSSKTGLKSLAYVKFTDRYGLGRETASLNH